MIPRIDFLNLEVPIRGDLADAIMQEFARVIAGKLKGTS
jgi:hypothetical protein